MVPMAKLDQAFLNGLSVILRITVALPLSAFLVFIGL